MARSNDNGCGSKHTVRDAAVVSRGKAMSQQRESIGVINGGSVQQHSDESIGNSNGTATGISATSNASNHSQIEGIAD
ncbi:hypothetical protein PUN28_001421 [Cardiocondyla obscurior]|uniref:Uncharacterized protein n=1 Tax=Cardiocondyla obscurior TaxID=286306 RepID=A0AAW2H5D3_9HYME